FDPRRKKPLPELPRRIAVVTSSTGAAVRDVIQTIQRRFPCIELLLHPVRVQGDGAAREIAAAIGAINREAARLGGIDVMIVGRGGGSLEDLWAFNEETVARAIFDSRIPVVSAVGHEVDVSIADLVADVRAATPTAAAELVVPVRDELLAALDQLAGRIGRAAANALEAQRARLHRVAACELFRDPLGWARRHEQRVDEASAHLRAGITHRLAAARSGLHRLELRLHRVRPEAVLARRSERLMHMDHRLRWAQGRASVLAERRLAATGSRLQQASPQRIIDRSGAVLEHLWRELDRGVRHDVERRREALRQFAARLAATGHECVLSRGFSITRLRRGRKLVTGPGDVREGDRISTLTRDGAFDSRVVDSRQGELFD
ncbi:MAG: exodeoxyribonuclease VII large subunit, partial [Phycisphaerae bacterium]